MTGVSAREAMLVNSIIIDAFVKAFQAYRDPGDGFRECVRAALTEVAPMIASKALEAPSVVVDDAMMERALWAYGPLVQCTQEYHNAKIKDALTAALKATP